MAHHFKLDMNARNMDEAMRCCKCGRVMGTKEECEETDQRVEVDYATARDMAENDELGEGEKDA